MKFRIYQLPMLEDLKRLMFSGYEIVCKIVSDFPNNWEGLYDKVYEAEYTGSETETNDILEDLFTIFNISKPEDFKGRSLSVSDIVVVDGVPYYCDLFGFKEIISKERKPMTTKEMKWCYSVLKDLDSQIRKNMSLFKRTDITALRMVTDMLEEKMAEQENK